MSIRRFSSRTEALDRDFLAKALSGATKYYRIAGYFRSSIFELVGEEIGKIPEVKIVCNSELDLVDFQVATRRSMEIKELWNDVDIEAEALLKKERYRRLDELLHSGNVEIRVVPRERLFLHGKAGSVHYADGSRKSFIGSVNESKSAFARNYELVWQDETPEAADWVEEEFWALWKDGVPLPEAILDEIHRVAHRTEVTVEVLKPEEVPAAALAEAPIYRGGEQLQPWQRSFVTLFLEHRERYGKARLLLADEVGVGKTLSMAASGLVSALLGDGPVLILTPSTLTLQWQVELKDKLGIPSAVWSSQKKAWFGTEGQMLSQRGASQSIKKCPYGIAIVSTGLITHQRKNHAFIKEAEALLSNRYGTVILDEAHKARMSGGIAGNDREPNNLLAFMREIGSRTRHLILGTATPIQTHVSELWDLLGILGGGADFVIGDALSPWREVEEAVEVITGRKTMDNAQMVWRWISNPLPPSNDSNLAAQIRENLNVPAGIDVSAHDFNDLEYLLQEIWLPMGMESGYFRTHNPLLRHVVLRKRAELEEAGLLERVGVNTHPIPEKNDLYQARFIDLGIPTNTPFEVAYEKAEEFCRLLQQRAQVGGFMKTLLLQRICSSFASGLNTAKTMLNRTLPDDAVEEDQLAEANDHILRDMGPGEISCLRAIIAQLSRPEAVDRKLETAKWFLTDFQSDGKPWIEHGCILFSQYYDTAEWVARELAALFKDDVVAVYAGLGRSGLFSGSQFNSVEREVIKAAVKRREIRLVVATDAACEGLNLQTLGTLINIDLPWNPSRLEQRLGRIRRFGQARKTVDMLNLVYSDTQDLKVYRVLSERLRGTFDIFGSIPDTIEDDWIEDEEEMRRRMDAYIHERDQAANAFTVKYQAAVNPDQNRWELCTRVLSRRDVVSQLSEPW
jgi:superfamily II DNA or RNA helicase